MEILGKVIVIALLYLNFASGMLELDGLTPAERKVATVENLRELRQKALLREEDLRIINGDASGVGVIYDPYIKLRDEEGKPSVAWLTSYGGDPFGFEVIFFALLPLVLAKLIRLTRNIFRPDLHLRQGITDFPLVPLIYLQQTKLEQRVKRERRNGIDWLGKKFLIRASDNFVDINEFNQHQPDQKIVPKNPWALLRFMAKFNVVYQHAKTHREGGHIPPEAPAEFGISPAGQVEFVGSPRPGKKVKVADGEDENPEISESNKRVSFEEDGSIAVDKPGAKGMGALRQRRQSIMQPQVVSDSKEVLELVPPKHPQLKGKPGSVDPQVWKEDETGQLKPGGKKKTKGRGQPDPENPTTTDSGGK